MKSILLVCIFLSAHIFAGEFEVPTTQPDILPERPTQPIFERPIKRVRSNHYYTNIASNCDEYLNIIEKKNKEIEALKKEIDRLKGEEQAKLSEKLKKEHDLKMKKFNERKSSIKTKNIITISNE